MRAVLLLLGTVLAQGFIVPPTNGGFFNPWAVQPFYTFPFMISASPSPSPMPIHQAPALSTSDFAAVDMNAVALSSWCDSQMTVASAAKLTLLANPKPTKMELLRISNVIDVALSNAGMLSSLLQETHPDAIVRSAATNCSLAVNALATNISLDDGIYRISLSVANDTDITDVVDQRRYDRIMRMFRRSGVALTDPAQRQRVMQLSNELDELATQFSVNLAHDTRYVVRNATDAVALAGLSADFIAARTVNGTVRISTDYPDLQPTLKFAQSEDLRRDLYVVYQQRGLPANLDILQQVLSKRHEKAKLLGYRSWAHYAIDVLMMGSETHADEFLTNVASLTRSRSQQEVAELLAAKKAAHPASTAVLSYDSSFYSEQVRQTSFAVDSNVINQYFRFNNTRDGVIRLAESMFNVRFQRNLAIPVWHPDVEVYDIFWKTSPELIGRIFLDMFPRENKYKHAAQFPIRSGVAGIQIPEGALICNFPKQGPMEHGQVTTFFHEFGHLMHHVIGGQQKRYIEFSGVATEWDFVEAPSQMLEEWAFDLSTLRTFAKKTSGEIIPEDLVAKLKSAEAFGRGIYAQQQTFYAKLSLRLHMADPSTLDVTDVMKTTMAEFAPFPYVEGTNMLAGFGHIMGYSAVYFTYLWSQAIAQQLLTTFRQSGSLTNPDVAMRYRDFVLRPGGLLDADKLVYEFTGHSVQLDAFNAWLLQTPHTYSVSQ